MTLRRAMNLVTSLLLAAGAASSAHAAFASIEDVSSGELASPLHRGVLGFLGPNDPMPTNAPVVFGIAPEFGPKGGGTAVVVSGLNFDKFGAGPSVGVSIGGSTAGGVSVQADTQLALTAPALASGPHDVVVTSLYGQGTLAQGFLATPAALASATVAPGASVALENWGPVGAWFETYWSTVAAEIPLPPFGTLLLGPPFFKILGNQLYPAPNGQETSAIPTPNDPLLSGLTVHWQSVAITSFAPLAVTLTNRASTSLL